MTTDHSPSLDEIREAAEKASGGEWYEEVDGSGVWSVMNARLGKIIGEAGWGRFAHADATYIAMMDPQTTLGLLARAENAEKERDAAVEKLRESERNFHNIRMEAERWGPDMSPTVFANLIVRLSVMARDGLRRFLADLSDKGER